MNTVNGIITDVIRSGGPRHGICFRATDGSDRHLVADASDSVLEACLLGALAHGDEVELRFEPIAPRLGAPLGVVRHLRVIGYVAEAGHAA